MMQSFEHTQGSFSDARLQRGPIIEDRPAVRRDQFLSDCFALGVSVIALVALVLLLG